MLQEVVVIVVVVVELWLHLLFVFAVTVAYGVEVRQSRKLPLLRFMTRYPCAIHVCP